MDEKRSLVALFLVGLFEESLNWNENPVCLFGLQMFIFTLLSRDVSNPNANMMGICMNQVFLMADGLGYGFVERSSLELPSFCTLQITGGAQGNRQVLLGSTTFWSLDQLNNGWSLGEDARGGSIMKSFAPQMNYEDMKLCWMRCEMSCEPKKEAVRCFLWAFFGVEIFNVNATKGRWRL